MTQIADIQLYAFDSYSHFKKKRVIIVFCFKVQYTLHGKTRLLQSKNKSAVLEKFSGFVKTTENEDEALVHKMMGEKFQVGKMIISKY